MPFASIHSIRDISDANGICSLGAGGGGGGVACLLSRMSLREKNEKKRNYGIASRRIQVNPQVEGVWRGDKWGVAH